MVLQILTVPCLADNYAYIAHDPATGVTAVIDVPEAEPILQALDNQGWTASLVLLTHHWLSRARNSHPCTRPRSL